MVLTAAAQAADARWPASDGRHAVPPDRRARRPPGCSGCAHATDAARAGCVLDEGAVAAVVERRTSLLPAGITGGRRRRSRRATRSTCATRTARAVARGLVNYDAAELPGLLGRSTRELARELGPAYEREVVHRDDLVILRP